LGLDGRAKPLSGRDGRRGVAPREVEELEWFGTGGASKWRSNSGGTRSSDGEAANTDGANGASGSVRQTMEE
jgi:hypothetical protein